VTRVCSLADSGVMYAASSSGVGVPAANLLISISSETGGDEDGENPVGGLVSIRCCHL